MYNKLNGIMVCIYRVDGYIHMCSGSAKQLFDKRLRPDEWLCVMLMTNETYFTLEKNEIKNKNTT